MSFQLFGALKELEGYFYVAPWVDFIGHYEKQEVQATSPSRVWEQWAGLGTQHETDICAGRGEWPGVADAVSRVVRTGAGGQVQQRESEDQLAP